MIELGDALRVLGISEPGDDLLYAIQTLNELIHDNEHYQAGGRSDLVDEDYGHDLNALAGRLGVSYKGRPMDAARVDSDLKELVVGTNFLSDRLVILPRRVAEHLAELYSALASSTWGELRENSSADIYGEVLGQAGYGSLDEFISRMDIGMPIPGARANAFRAFVERIGKPLPPDDEPFSAEHDIGSYVDGDFPPAPGLLMLGYLPREVIEQFGHVYETVFNGTYVDFPSGQRDEILAMLERRGYHCIEDQTLINRADRS